MINLSGIVPVIAITSWLLRKGKKEDKFPNIDKLRDVKDLPNVWGERPSIYEHVKKYVDAGKERTSEGSERLPDEEVRFKDIRVRWAPGALDGVTTFHSKVKKNEKLANSILETLKRTTNNPSDNNLKELYDLLVDDTVLGFVDLLLDKIVKNKEAINSIQLYSLAVWLATRAPDRGAVKVGIAILGIYSNESSRGLLLTLGRHDEFTLYSLVALSRISKTFAEDCLELAKSTEGWGRIHVITRLPETDDTEIKDWLLREGYRNSIMYEYLALECAKRGDLLAALNKKSIDDELLDSAGDMLEAMTREGPVGGITFYEDGAKAVERYLELISQRICTVKQLVKVCALNNFLTAKKMKWEALGKKGWTSEKRKLFKEKCRTIIDRPRWKEEILSALESEKEEEFHAANTAAGYLGLDTWKCHSARLEQKPLKSARWYCAMKSVKKDDKGLRKILQVARENLPLKDLATGPKDNTGLGPTYETDSCLGYILQDLGSFKGEGIDLVKVGLRNRVTRNRNLALKILGEWRKEYWEKDIEDILKQAYDEEPVTETKKMIKNILEGKPLEETDSS